MQIKHLIGASVLAVAMPFGVSAGEKNPEEKADKVVERLDLDNGRAEEVRQILENHSEQKKDIKERAHDQIKDLKDQKEQQLEAVLTESEMDELKEMKEEKKDKHKKHKKDKDKDRDE